MNLTGRWIGETQGSETQRRRWVIIQQGGRLKVLTRWDSELGWGCYPGSKAVGDHAFVVTTGWGDYRATPQGDGSLIVSRWVADTHDVVFRRQDAGAKHLCATIILRALNALAFRRWQARVEQGALGT
jgi:hypothetical protein